MISVYVLMPIPSSTSVAGLAAPLLLCAQLLVAGRAQREVERALVVAGVVRHAAGRLVREGVLGDEVLPPHLGGIHADLGGEQVHRAFDRLRRLGTARRRAPSSSASCS